MADDSLRTPGTGETIRTVQKGTPKTEVIIVDWGGSGTEDIGGGAVGRAAEDAALSGNPVRQGVRASTAVPTAMSADGDVVTPWADRSGAAVVVPRLDQLLIIVTPTIDTAVYAAGDRLGSVMTLANAAIGNGRGGTFVRAVMTDFAPSAFNIDVAFFQNTPTLVNADNGAYDITDANLAAAVPIAFINFDTANSYAQGANNRTVLGTSFGGPIVVPYTCASGSTSIFAVPIARGSYDAVSTTDLTFYFNVIRD